MTHLSEDIIIGDRAAREGLFVSSGEYPEVEKLPPESLEERRVLAEQIAQEGLPSAEELERQSRIRSSMIID